MATPIVTIITGNSNSGSSCIAELFKRYNDKVSVRGAFRGADKAEPLKQKYPKLEVVCGVDADKPETLDAAFRGAQSALIVTPFTRESLNGASNDAQLTINMISKAVDNGVKNIVLVSAWTTPYAQITMTNARFKPPEDFLIDIGKKKKISWTILRAGYFMENCLFMFKDSIKEKSVINFPNVHIPMVDTRDIGKSAAACLVSTTGEHNGKLYDITGPELLRGSDMAQKFSKVLGREIKLNQMTQETVKQNFPPYIANIYEFIFEKGKNAVPFTEDVKKLTGQNGTFEQFIKDHLHNFS